MSKVKTIETVHGKSTTTEVREKSGLMGKSQYLRDKDTEKVVSGTFHDRGKAVDAAKKRGGKE